MEVPRSSNSKGKAKVEDTKREPNWTLEETGHLLNAISQIHTIRGHVGFSFSKQEKNEIFRLFQISIPGTVREKEKLINRVKVLKKMYKVCKELANRSGGGWDDNTHRPIAPSDAEYIEMVQAKGESGKFLLKGNFPWYRQMVPMVGGQTSRGEVRRKTYSAEQPIHCLLDAQMSIQCSEQGSSDSPDEGFQNPTNSDSVQAKGRGPGSSRTGDNGQSSDASIPQSRCFGSKRKSTDESSDYSSKGKRFKERVRKKKAEQDRLADAAFEIARVISEETRLKLVKQTEEDECMALFEAWGITGRAHDFCTKQMENNGFRRKWFLKHEKHVVFEWIERNIGYSVPDPNQTQMPPPNPSFNAAAPNQTWFQPAQSAFNYPNFNPHP